VSIKPKQAVYAEFAAVARALGHAHRLELLEHLAQGHVPYRLADETVLTLFSSLRKVAERNVAEIGRIVRSYFTDLDDLEPVSREALLERLRDGQVTVLDVRPADEFAMGHLPGALNAPMETLEQRLEELDPDQEIVAYCRGAYCVLSFEAVATLRERGFNVRRLEDGYPEWRAAGLPVETGS